jgi:hypothetical protein
MLETSEIKVIRTIANKTIRERIRNEIMRQVESQTYDRMSRPMSTNGQVKTSKNSRRCISNCMCTITLDASDNLLLNEEEAICLHWYKKNIINNM